MPLHDRKILPAVRHPKDFEKLLDYPYEYMVLLDCRIGMLKGFVREAERGGKKILLHADLVHGLKNDEYAAEFLCQDIKPAGLISTRASVIAKAKENGRIAIQRLFLLDSGALEKSYALLEKTRPDYIEVLPGLMPHIIAEVHQKTGIPIFAGGLVRTVEEVERAVAAGASAVTTSDRTLWDYFR